MELDETIIKANLSEWKDIYRRLGSIISRIESDKRDKELDEEYERYEGETQQQISKRIYDSNEWVFEKIDYKISPSEIDCMEDDCWSKGNLDRLGEYDGEYRLKGTDYRLCRVCYQNERFGQIEEDAKQSYPNGEDNED